MTSKFNDPRILRKMQRLIPILFFLSAILSWPAMTQMELFERYYTYSQTHETWDVDKLAVLVINLTIAMTLTSLYQWRKLQSTIRQREVQRLRAESNARHDPLTGLLNRRAFSELLEQVEHKKLPPYGRVIAMLDLDRFKPVNDLHGHAAGDHVLCTIASRLSLAAGMTASVTRLGGDEFAILFAPGVDMIQAERLSRQILQSVGEAIPLQQGQIFVGCSIGLVTWKQGCHGDEAMRRADKALYMAKDLGKGQFAWYDAELDHRSHERAGIEADLRNAIRNDEIEPWFQPIIEIDNKSLTGFEVLARWNHSERGPISPGVFIEIAEDSGQIGALGMSVLRQACKSAGKWDPKLTISFNVSPHQFHDPMLVDQIKTILAECRFDASRLTIEVTESSVIHDFDVAREKLDALKELGVAVALDDFGTGYSSLASLRQLPFDRIKIDRSFITNIASEPQNQKIVNGIMALANGLELDVTAEGIETRDDLGYLEELDCSLGQGFLFEKALPAQEISWLLESKWSDGHVDAGDVPPPAAKAKTA